MNKTEHVVIIGAGIVGLATAWALTQRGYRVTVLEKEPDVAQHQTGNNSGVIHSGLYYTPGSAKAHLAVAGAGSMTAFAKEHGINVDICGKLVVATREGQIPAVHELMRRGEANGVPCRLLDPAEARVFEPNVDCVAAIRVESTGVVDYGAVSQTLRHLIEQADGEVRCEARVVGIRISADGVVVETEDDQYQANRLVNCAGLYSDRIARLAGLTPDVQIIPFRGEYFELAASSADLVKGLIYPVPEPGLPFLGVHLTRMLDGSVHAGPNAVLALAREGYSWRRIRGEELMDTLRWPGLWRMARKYWKVGASEVARSLDARRFARSLQELVPDLPADGIIPASAGVRAQAVHRDGSLVDDFHFLRRERDLHVLNAPSPAATAALQIGAKIAQELAST